MTEGLLRRDLLGAAGSLIALDLLGVRCSGGGPRKTVQVSIFLRDLPVGSRRTLIVGENPVEVLRTAGGVTARMLRCTHMGCVVRWREQQRVYACPCHEGRYDENGKVLAGPPMLPLRAVPVAIVEGRALVGAPFEQIDAIAPRKG